MPPYKPSNKDLEWIDNLDKAGKYDILYTKIQKITTNSSIFFSLKLYFLDPIVKNSKGNL